MKQPIRTLAFYLHSRKHAKHVGGSEHKSLETSTHLRKPSVETFTLEYKPSLARKRGHSGYHSIKINRRFINHTVLDPIRIILHDIEANIKNIRNTDFLLIFSP